MNHENFNERVEWVRKASEAVADLDPCVRGPALQWILEGPGRWRPEPDAAESAEVRVERDSTAAGDQEDPVAFFAKFSNEKPADNLMTIAAYHYSLYGSEAISIDEARDLASQVGLVIPERLDMTFGQARRSGKNLFRRAGRGSYAPTVNGELFFQSTYEVVKGRKKKLADA